MSRIHFQAVVAAVLLTLAIPAAADAAVTSTQITDPAGMVFPFVDVGQSGDVLTVSGNATAGNGDSVDIRCYSSPDTNTYSNLVINVPVVGGRFSASNVGVDGAAGTYCHLVAVPAGTAPSSLDAFAGPTIAVDSNTTFTSVGKTWDYKNRLLQPDGTFSYRSISRCGISDSYLRSPATGFFGSVGFSCSHAFTSNILAARSSLQVDGLNAFAAGYNSQLAPFTGFQPVTFSSTIDRSSGDGTIHESDRLMTCPGLPWPPAAPNCSALTGLPVRVDRTITQGNGGLVSTIIDDYVSLDGQPHALDIGYYEGVCLTVPGFCASDYQFDFPGRAAIVNPGSGVTVSGPFGQTATIFSSDPNPADSSTSTRLAMTFFPAPASGLFIGASGLILDWPAMTVPATGSLRITGAFAQATSQAQVAQLALASAIGMTPQPTIAATAMKAHWSKKVKRVVLSGPIVACPARGEACAVTTTLSTKVRLPAKKPKHHRRSHKKKKSKAKYKTYRFKALTLSAAAGANQPLSWTLPSYATKLFRAHKSLKFALGTTVTAGPYASANNTAVLKVNSPKVPKPKSKRKKSSHKHRR